MIYISISQARLAKLYAWFNKLNLEYVVVTIATVLAIGATAYFYHKGWIIAYGDAESHLNISKRVIHSLTPGFAQLGGIWLPIPHMLMLPFVYFDSLWRTGLAGSIVSGLSFIISSLYIFRLTKLITGHKWASFVASLVFMANLNILYLQSTPMTELVLIVFFILSTYYFIKFLQDIDRPTNLMLAAFYGFVATLSRYDGWFLVAAEAGVLVLLYLPWKAWPRKVSEIVANFSKEKWQKLEGHALLFALPAFFGILIWFVWGYLILGDPLYFTHSSYSAKSQQQSWLARGELPAYNHIWESFWYYFITSMSNIGVIVFVMAIVGLIWYIKSKHRLRDYYALLILLVPFVFNVVTLYLGQSVIFIPHITPVSFEWRLFNVRYGVMMVPFAAFIVGYLFWKLRAAGRTVLIGLLICQLGLYAIGYSRVISMDDGVVGLSSAVSKLPDAQRWITENYDGGLVLVDDFARTLSIVRSGIPMQNVIYVGNKPYWPDSLVAPEKHATWLIMQENDELWRTIFEPPDMQGRLYKYFVKVYTSPQILVFKRNPDIPAEDF
jgi:hypothetical protein